MNILKKYPNSIFLKGLPEDSEFFPLRQRIIELFRFLNGLEAPHFEQELEQRPHAREGHGTKKHAKTQRREWHTWKRHQALALSGEVDAG